jgi:nitroreductase
MIELSLLYDRKKKHSKVLDAMFSRFGFLSLMAVQGVAAFQSVAPLLVDATFLEASTTAIEETKSSWVWIRTKLRRKKKCRQQDFDSILQSRRTINSFLTELPNDWESTLSSAIQSAVHAPNHKRTEPWRFHLLGNETIQKVCELNAAIVTKKKGDKAGKKKLERWLQMPGWLVVTCKTSGSNESMDQPASLEREDYAACCCAVQNLCLSIHSAGMGTKWTTGPVNFDPRFGEIVGLDENEYVVGTIWFGTPEKLPDAPGKKKIMEDVLVKHN